MKYLFDPFPKQMEFLEAVFSGKYNVIVYGGAIRGGKTFGGLGILILLCYFYPGSRWAIVRKDLPTLKRNTIPSFKKIVPTNFLKGASLAKGYNQSEQVVTFNNGSQILFFPANFIEDKELDRWKGLEVNGFLLEELNELDVSCFYKAIERAGSHIIPGLEKQPKPVVLGTCNPSQGYVKDLIYTPHKENRLEEGFLYIPSKITDNPHIPPEYIESLKRLPRLQYQVFVLGNWDIKIKNGAEIYKSFSVDKHLTSEKYRRDLPIHIAFDENVVPYLPCTIWQAEGLRVWQIDEITMQRPANTLTDLCNEILRRYKFHKSGCFIYGDATSKKDDTKLERGQNFFKLAASKLEPLKPSLRVPKSNPSVVMRMSFINAIFEKKYGGCEVLIGEDCLKTIEDLTNVFEAADGTKLKIVVKDPKTKVSYQPYGHLSDSMDYFICEYFKSQYKAYQDGPAPPPEKRVFGKRIIKRTY